MELNILDFNKVGTIELKEKVYVTDPCYDIDARFQAYIDNVTPGNYACFTVITDEGELGHRVAELHVVKEDFFSKYHNNVKEIPYDANPIPIYIGVDSGQCGIFDADYYEKHQPDDDYDNPNSWYRKVCNITDDFAGITDNIGVVTSSGYGNGIYPLFVVREDDKIVAMKVVFISEDEKEEEIQLNKINMEDYEIIGWPDIQYFMDLEGFKENSTLIEPNDNMGIGSSTYLINKEWLESLKDE